jgi:hypothetical protein
MKANFAAPLLARNLLCKNTPNGVPCHLLYLLVYSGAGEEIRTLDPNLGKVVLYH